MGNRRSKPLSLWQRQEIWLLDERGLSRERIGHLVCCSKSTVSRELNTKRVPEHKRKELGALGCAKLSHARAKENRARRSGGQRKIVERRPDLQRRILLLLEEEHHSPEVLADMLSQSDLGQRLSGQTIRRFVNDKFPNYKQHFPHRGKRPRKHLTPRRGKLRQAAPEKTSVHQRGSEAAGRLRAGDFELDLVVCHQSLRCILSIRDRKTRRSWTAFVEDRKAETVRRAIIKFVQTLPEALRRTLTYDRGSEFAEVDVLEKHFGLSNYFCDAYCAWQKGSVENQNKDLRRFFAKGTDLSLLTEAQLQRVTDLINVRPRPCLNGWSSGDAWMLELRNAKLLMH